jgi:two-component system NtrC family response regulator
LVARCLHDYSKRQKHRFVAVNCGGMPETLLESELFGHEAGAFTGADRRRVGRFEQADGGTLFLDEIGEMPPGMQAKLLRVLQDGSFERVGGTETLRVNIRLLAATNIDLAAAVASGKFREDLYYRLNGVTVEVPALRDRDPENVPLLIDHCLNRIRQRGGPTWTFSAEALRRLSSYAWPGNVRELENLVELMVVIAPGREIQLEDLPAHIVPSREEPVSLAFDLQRPLPKITEELTARVESAYLRRVLETYRGRIDACAAHCKLSRRSISEKLRRHNIDKSEYKIDRTRRAPAAGAL